jgi:hypothetical protein
MNDLEVTLLISMYVVQLQAVIELMSPTSKIYDKVLISLLLENNGDSLDIMHAMSLMCCMASDNNVEWFVLTIF